MEFILASASPRRKELLLQIGLNFSVIPAVGEEEITSSSPKSAVIELSRQKAEEIAISRMDGKDIIIIGADTVVAFQGEILGKPRDEMDAIRMLTLLQGNKHKVYTGVCLIGKKQGETIFRNFLQETEVKMYPMTAAEITAYVSTREPMDKAGAYGIQGRCAAFIERINGDYNNVVGLPVSAVYQELNKLGIAIYQDS